MSKVKFTHNHGMHKREQVVERMLNNGNIPLCTLPNAEWYGLDDECTLCVWDDHEGLVAVWENKEWVSYIGKGL